MKLHAYFRSCSLVLCGTALLTAAAADTSALSGTVRDAQGNAIAGVSVTLSATPGNTETLSQKVVSDASGRIVFQNIAAGDYTLHASANGNTASVSVHAPSASPVILTLLSHPKLQLQASGLHGLIDPGGYSASASADAASGLVKGIADMKRGDKNFGGPSASDWPCALEPKLVETLRAHPDQSESNRRLGVFHLAHHQPAAAIALLGHTLQLDPSDVAAARDLAIAQMQIGDFAAARALLTSLVTRDDTADDHQLLAKADEGSGLFHEAAQEYRIADREIPSEQNVLGVGYELTLAGSPADAIKIFEGGTQRYPQSMALHIGVGVSQFLLGHPDESLRSFLKAVELNPMDPRAYPFLAAASGVSMVEAERVRNAFRRYTQLTPESAAANYFYALNLSRSNAEANAQQMEDLLNLALQLDPGMARAHLQLADLYALRIDYGHAVPEYEAAVRLAPDLSEAHYRLALAYKRAGRTEQSEIEMQKFQQSKTKSSGSASDDIDIAQFISVIDPPAQDAGREGPCNEPVR